LEETGNPLNSGENGEGYSHYLCASKKAAQESYFASFKFPLKANQLDNL